MTAAPKTTEVFDDLIAALGEIRDGYVLNPERFTDPLDIVEGFRYVGQVLAGASEMFFEADTAHPHFVSIVSPERKLQGDNPDAIYHVCRVQGDLGYRVSGTIEKQCYTSFTVHGKADDGGLAGPLLGDLNDRDFDVADDGSYELIFSATRPTDTSADTAGRNWIELHPDAYNIIVRSYYQEALSAQNDANINVRLDIETIDDVGPPAPLDDETLAKRMAEGVAFLRQATIGQNLPGKPSEVPFVSNVPNDVVKPFSFRDTGLPVPGAADIFYSMGRFSLDDGQAMVMSGTLPDAPFANVMLWNKHMQTMEYRNRQSSLNLEQIQLEDDGTYKIFVSNTDPGHPNWLDAGGHDEGTIFWRFLLPETDPTKPDCEVLNL